MKTTEADKFAIGWIFGLVFLFMLLLSMSGCNMGFDCTYRGIHFDNAEGGTQYSCAQVELAVDCYVGGLPEEWQDAANEVVDDFIFVTAEHEIVERGQTYFGLSWVGEGRIKVVANNPDLTQTALFHEFSHFLYERLNPGSEDFANGSHDDIQFWRTSESATMRGCKQLVLNQ